jgi:hypothetical protein
MDHVLLVASWDATTSSLSGGDVRDMYCSWPPGSLLILRRGLDEQQVVDSDSTG